MREIEAIIKEMLKENTGTHFLDSGGAYGRSWQQNQDRDFENEPELKVEAYEDNDISLFISTYHYLTNMLEITDESEKLNAKYQKFAAKSEESYLHDMEEFTSRYQGAYTTNTYNFENLLDQVLQYVTFEHEGEDYILLQIHGGCDVRGGYTKPQIFQLIGKDYFIMRMNDVSCGNSKNCWDSDDGGYHWYPNISEHKLEFKVKDNKVYDKKTGKELRFSVCHSI